MNLCSGKMQGKLFLRVSVTDLQLRPRERQWLSHLHSNEPGDPGLLTDSERCGFFFFKFWDLETVTLSQSKDGICYEDGKTWNTSPLDLSSWVPDLDLTSQEPYSRKGLSQKVSVFPSDAWGRLGQPVQLGQSTPVSLRLWWVLILFSSHCGITPHISSPLHIAGTPGSHSLAGFFLRASDHGSAINRPFQQTYVFL
jgi:hypothetical protein